MKILIDMNLSPLWANLFQEHGYEAAHWSSIGHASASDELIFEFAGDNKDAIKSRVRILPLRQ